MKTLLQKMTAAACLGLALAMLLSLSPLYAAEPEAEILCYASPAETLATNTAAGAETDLRLPDNMRIKYNAGSCRRLEGTPYLLVVYLDDDVSSWTEEEVKANQDNLIRPAVDYIEKAAADRGVFLDIATGYYATYGHPDRPVKYDGIVDNYNNGTTSNDILEQVAATLGYTSKTNMHTEICKYAGTEQVAYMIMLDKGGRSYSIAHYKPEEVVNQHYWMEYCMIFSGFTDTSYDSASDTIVHELLHVFGAEDYYRPETRKALAKEHFPTDIMLCDMSDLEFFTIDDYTAYTLGWTDEIPQVCYDPNWWPENYGN